MLKIIMAFIFFSILGCGQDSNSGSQSEEHHHHTQDGKNVSLGQKSCSHDPDKKKDLGSFTLSENGSAKVALSIDSDFLQSGKEHSYSVTLGFFTPSLEPLHNVTLINAMPFMNTMGHGSFGNHSLEKLDDMGHLFLIRGVQFNMGGSWVMKTTFSTENGQDSVDVPFPFEVAF